MSHLGLELDGGLVGASLIPMRGNEIPVAAGTDPHVLVPDPHEG